MQAAGPAAPTGRSKTCGRLSRVASVRHRRRPAPSDIASLLGVSDTNVPLTLLTVHAHPDDEASKGAPTLAKYHAEGVRTVLVCCHRR